MYVDKTSLVSDDDKNKMADLIQEEAKFTSWDYVYYDRESAMTIVDTFIKAGWSPNNDTEGKE